MEGAATRSPVAARSMRRLLIRYAVATLFPVLLLGVVLSLLLRAQAEDRGLAQARDRAALAGQVVFAPLLQGVDLRAGVDAVRRQALAAAGARVAVGDRVLRFRVRALDGRVVFASDGSPVGAPGPVDQEVLEAAQGHVESELTRLNADGGDTGPVGPRVVEVYEPLVSSQGIRIGVLEMYVPYEPIASEIAAERRDLQAVLVAGLVALWAVLLAITISVTRRLRRQVEATAFLAEYDTLTALPNRASFRDRIQQALDSDPAGTVVGVLDLDRFQQINDALGHSNGDRLLEELGRRLAASMRRGDTVARLGGDEFGVVLRNVVDADEAADVMTRLRGVLTDAVDVAGLPLAVEASAGFALAPEDGGDTDALLRRADVAMYAAKRRQLGVARYDPQASPDTGGTLALIGELRRAIDADELLLHYQPKVDVAGGQVIAVEALVRWQHPKRGLLFPDAFLPAVEQTELIEPLTWWVLERATQDLARLDPDGRLTVAVNVSARSVGRSGFADDVLDLLSRTDMPPGRVVLEMTETALLVDPKRAVAALRRLAEAGVRVSIDDFGAGQTSLGYLAAMPVTEVKIDKGFVLDLVENPRHAAIVRSVVGLAHSLNLSVTAEGVETADALAALGTMRCDAAQGYLLSRPLPVEELAGRIASLEQRVRVSATV
jgi:diguanylate cyclase (GGDEF)-like protein